VPRQRTPVKGAKPPPARPENGVSSRPRRGPATATCPLAQRRSPCLPGARTTQRQFRILAPQA